MVAAGRAAPAAGGVEGVIERLQRFWCKRGCALIQPLDCNVGAGTFHHATFLRALGPEPWDAVYVQPSRRPADGRYGDSPNRLQHYFQLQVVQKPSPADFQDAYLDSLAALGIDAGKHDVRFIEDDWESPSLGAWGLGWEVWLDGMEITQFTYFQEVGGRECRPVMGEITYGIERLAMYLQQCDSVYDLVWRPGLSYGEMFRVAEREQSLYNFRLSDPDRLRQEFDGCESDCQRLLEADPPLVTPAYELMLSCSHTFNLLDARGVVSATERAGFISRVRALAAAVASGYERQRQLQGHPLLAAAAPAAARRGRPQR